MQKSFSLKQTIKEQIITHCMKKKPHEACGFLLGTADSTIIYADLFVPVPNISPNPSYHFTMDPYHLIPLVTQISPSGRSKIIGIIHSHPHAAAVPSNEDLLTPWNLVPAHLIVSLVDETPVIKAYHYSKFQENGNIPLTNTGISYDPIPIVLTDN